ncbi:oligosaccharide flippase family protein [Paraburkholderia nemoris]|uniref:oligosaccharide flippase family protein n=1 Tax=Paraburkholderia nemoris TaxID=2793076 RepID=UPI0038BD101A
MSNVKVVRNFAFNLGGSALPIAISLVTVPAYLHHLGGVRYGVLTFVWTLVGYFGILDLGISRATANRIAQSISKGGEQSSAIFWNAVYLNVCLGIVGAVIFFVWGGAILNVLVKVPASYHAEISAAVPWIAVSIPVVNLSAVLGGALEGGEHFGKYNAVQFLGTLGVQVLPLLAGLLISPSLQAVVPAAAIARFVTCFMLTVVVRGTFRFGLVEKFSRATATDLLHFGKWVVTTSSIRVLADNADRFAVSSVVGASALSFYGVSQNLILRCTLMPNAVARTLFPRFSNCSSQEGARLCLSALELHGYIYTACLVAGVLLIQPFLQLWIGASFARDGAPAARLLILGVWASGQSAIVISFLQASGRANFVARLSLTETPVVVGSMWLAAHTWGVVGVSVVVMAKSLIDFVVLLAIGRLFRGAFRVIVSCLSSLGIIYLVVVFYKNPSLDWSVAGILIAYLLFCARGAHKPLLFGILRAP